jgi:hypothetical protein
LHAEINQTSDHAHAHGQGGGIEKNDKKKASESESKFIVLFSDVDFFSVPFAMTFFEEYLKEIKMEQLAF